MMYKFASGVRYVGSTPYNLFPEHLPVDIHHVFVASRAKSKKPLSKIHCVLQEFLALNSHRDNLDHLIVSYEPQQILCYTVESLSGIGLLMKWVPATAQSARKRTTPSPSGSGVLAA